MALTEIPSELSSTPSIVDNGNATAITIDASRNLLVGTTTTNIATEGTVIYGLGNEGVMTLSSTNMTALYVNRSTDGELVQFRQGGSTVAGSIGGGATFLTIGSGTGNVYFQNGVMAPTASSSGASSSGVVDIGTASSRFKDLYLSGGVVFGDAGGSGTPSSNTLDSYEEGTWTPVLTKSTTAPSVTYTYQVGTYTKVGRMIYVSGYLSWTAMSGGAGSFRVAGLPFTILSSVSAYPQMVSTDYSGITFGANDTTFGGYGAINGTHIVLLAAKNNATGSTQISGLATSGFMYFNLTYQEA